MPQTLRVLSPDVNLPVERDLVEVVEERRFESGVGRAIGLPRRLQARSGDLGQADRAHTCGRVVVVVGPRSSDENRGFLTRARLRGQARPERGVAVGVADRRLEEVKRQCG